MMSMIDFAWLKATSIVKNLIGLHFSARIVRHLLFISYTFTPDICRLNIARLTKVLVVCMIKVHWLA